jgi:hypothetical protein
MPGSNFIRTFAKFFTNLNRHDSAELERALSEIQNLKEITSLETSLELLRRRVDQRLPIPQLTVFPTVRGAAIEWEGLPDQRINFYEIDVSPNNNFATVTTVTTFANEVIIDGLTQTQFIRVRGVRRDGTTTPYSDTSTLSPNLFDVRSHSLEAFYVPITGTLANTVLGGDGTDLDYIPINPDGESLVWGFVSVYADPAVALFGLDQIFAEVIVTRKDSTGSEIDSKSECTVTFGEHYNSTSLGPFTVEHPGLNGTVEIKLDVTDRTALADGSARSADSTEVFWAHLNILELGIGSA